MSFISITSRPANNAETHGRASVHVPITVVSGIKFIEIRFQSFANAMLSTETGADVIAQPVAAVAFTVYEPVIVGLYDAVLATSAVPLFQLYVAPVLAVSVIVLFDADVVSKDFATINDSVPEINAG